MTSKAIGVVLIAGWLAGGGFSLSLADEETSLKTGLSQVVQESKLHNDEVYVVEIGANWCRGCRELDQKLSKPEYDFLKKSRRKIQMGGDDDHLAKDFAQEFGIQPPYNGIPLLVTIKNGKPVGFVSPESIRKTLKDPATFRKFSEGKLKNIESVPTKKGDALSIAKPLGRVVTDEEIKSGKFRDDDFPLPWALELPAEALTPPSPCAAQVGQAGPSWTTGFRQALSGQRFMLSSNSTQNPARKACQAERIAGRERDLACCIAGFRKGLPLLKQRLKDLSESLEHGFPKTRAGDAELQCASEYRAGGNTARSECREFKRGVCYFDQSGRADGGIRYLGCYSLGFQAEFANCRSEDGRKVQEYLVRNWPGVYEANDNTKSSRATPTSSGIPDLGLPSESAAGTARE